MVARTDTPIPSPRSPAEQHVLEAGFVGLLAFIVQMGAPAWLLIGWTGAFVAYKGLVAWRVSR